MGHEGKSSDCRAVEEITMRTQASELNLAPDQPAEVDVLVVGAGPIGLEVAAALRERSVDYLHIDAGNIASTIGWYSPGTQIFSSPDRLAIAGIPFMVYPGTRATREDYLNYLRTVVAAHGLEVRRYHHLSRVERSNGRFLCDIAHSRVGVGGERADHEPRDRQPLAMRVLAQRIVLAIGNMHVPRRLGIEGESLPHVGHYLGDVHDYAGCRVAIVGSRNSATEAAVRLARLDAKVSLCFRAAEFDRARVKPWILPDVLSLAREGKITLYPSVRPIRITSESLVLERLDAGHETIEVPADRVCLLTGYSQTISLFEMIGVHVDGQTRVPTHDIETMQTNIPGVFVVGTAAAGSQLNGATHFIENCHGHAARVILGLGLSLAAPKTIDRAVEHREE